MIIFCTQLRMQLHCAAQLIEKMSNRPRIIIDVINLNQLQGF
jgi:hypothetical protein